MRHPAGTSRKDIIILAAIACKMIEERNQSVKVVLERRHYQSWSMTLEDIGQVRADFMAYLFTKADDLGVPWAYSRSKHGVQSVHFGKHRPAYLRPGDRVPNRQE